MYAVRDRSAVRRAVQQALDGTHVLFSPAFVHEVAARARAGEEIGAPVLPERLRERAAVLFHIEVRGLSLWHVEIVPREQAIAWKQRYDKDVLLVATADEPTIYLRLLQLRQPHEHFAQDRLVITDEFVFGMRWSEDGRECTDADSLPGVELGKHTLE